MAFRSIEPTPGSESTVLQDDLRLDHHNLLDSLPAAVVYLDRDLHFVYANKTYADWRNLPLASIIGRHCREVAGSNNFAALQRYLKKALAGKNSAFDYDFMHNGIKRHLHTQLMPDKRPDGSIVGLIAHLIESPSAGRIDPAMAESEALFNNAFSSSPIGMAIVDTVGRLVRANESFATMLGRSEDDLTGMEFRVITHPDDIDADLLLFRQVLAGTRNGYKIDKRYLRQDGGIVETTLTVSAMRNAAGEAVRFFSQIEDITERRIAERKLAESNARLALAMDVVRGGFWHMDIPNAHFETSVRLAEFIAGANASAMNLESYVRNIDPADRRAADLSRLVEGVVDRSDAEYRLATINGPRWMRCDRRLLRDSQGNPLNIIGVVTDITEEREELLRSEQRAATDSLTGLLNRRGLQLRFAASAPVSSFGVLAIDLDGFKQVNDTMGHKAGDDVLIETARRLREAVRDTDLVARLGGDEFTVILADVEPLFLTEVAERINTALRIPFETEGRPASVRCSIGIAWSDEATSGLEALMRQADTVLYDAKSAGKDTWRLAGTASRSQV